MSFPSPLLSPNEFLDHVRSLGLDSITTLFRHYQRRPVPSSPGGHYDMSDTHEWCDRMDTLLGMLSRAVRSHPTHAEVFRAASDLCVSTVTDLESGLARQLESDNAEAKRLRQKEMARIGAQLEAKEVREMLMTNEYYRRDIEIMERELKAKHPEQDRQDIETLKSKLAARKYSLHYAESLLEDMDYEDMEYDDDDGDDDHGLDAPNMMIKEEPKSPISLLHTQREVYTTTTDTNAIGHMNVDTTPSQTVEKRRTTGHMDPISVNENPMHTVPKRRETAVSGPYRVRFGGVRGLPQPTPTDSNAIGDMDPIKVDTNTSRTVGKRRATVTHGPTRVRFGGTLRPEMPTPAPRPTRRSMRLSKDNSRKRSGELFARLAQGFHDISKTCEEIAETMD